MVSLTTLYQQTTSQTTRDASIWHRWMDSGGFELTMLYKQSSSSTAFIQGQWSTLEPVFHSSISTIDG
jgi:hypothetical protein